MQDAEQGGGAQGVAPSTDLGTLPPLVALHSTEPSTEPSPAGAKAAVAKRPVPEGAVVS